MAVHSFGFDENYRKNISSVLQEKRFRFRCFWNELHILKKKKKKKGIYSKTLIAKLKAIGKSLDRTCYYNFGVHFCCCCSLSRWLLFSLLRDDFLWGFCGDFHLSRSATRYQRERKWNRLRSFPPKKHIESTTFRWNFLEIKRPTWDVKFQNKIPFSATYANRSSKRIEVDSIWTIHRPPSRRFFKFF